MAIQRKPEQGGMKSPPKQEKGGHQAPGLNKDKDRDSRVEKGGYGGSAQRSPGFGKTEEREKGKR